MPTQTKPVPVDHKQQQGKLPLSLLDSLRQEAKRNTVKMRELLRHAKS